MMTPDFHHGLPSCENHRMRFGSIAIDDAVGCILGHNVTGDDGRRVLRKGRALEPDDIETLRALGRSTVYAAVLVDGDVDEDTAARRITEAVVGTTAQRSGARLSRASTGRVNVYALELALVRVDVPRLERLNQREGVTLATVRDRSVVGEGRMIGTTKILPYALPAAVVDEIEREAADRGPLLWTLPLESRRAGLVVFAASSARERVEQGYASALRARLESLGSRLERIDFVALDEESGEESLAQAIREQLSGGVELLLLAGETAIQDRNDLAPRAVELAGGEVIDFGAPVDPGNLLMLAYIDRVPVVGAPGCARSPKGNIVDLVLPRLLAGERMTRADIVALGHGGLLEDVPERPMPRRRAEG